MCVCICWKLFKELKTSAHPYYQTSKISVVHSTSVKIRTASVKSTCVRKMRKVHPLLLPTPDTLLLLWFFLPSGELPVSSWCSTSAWNFCTFFCCGCSHMYSLKIALPKTVYTQVSPLLQWMISPGFCEFIPNNCVKSTDAYAQHPSKHLNTVWLYRIYIIAIIRYGFVIMVLKLYPSSHPSSHPSMLFQGLNTGLKSTCELQS